MNGQISARPIRRYLLMKNDFDWFKEPWLLGEYKAVVGYFENCFRLFFWEFWTTEHSTVIRGSVTLTNSSSS